jgi:hypothetical protein
MRGPYPKEFRERAAGRNFLFIVGSSVLFEFPVVLLEHPNSSIRIWRNTFSFAFTNASLPG